MKYETRDVRIIRIRIAKIQMIRVADIMPGCCKSKGQEGDQGNAGDAVCFKTVCRRSYAVARVVACTVSNNTRVLRDHLPEDEKRSS